MVDDDMLDLTLDRFGRVWALGAVSLAIVDVGNPAAPIPAPTEGGTR
jgi:hypothetical protein